MLLELLCKFGRLLIYINYGEFNGSYSSSSSSSSSSSFEWDFVSKKKE